MIITLNTINHTLCSLLLRRFVFHMAEESAKRVTGDHNKPQGTMGRVHPAFLCAHIFIKRETSGYEAVPYVFVFVTMQNIGTEVANFERNSPPPKAILHNVKPCKAIQQPEDIQCNNVTNLISYFSSIQNNWIQNALASPELDSFACCSSVKQ